MKQGYYKKPLAIFFQIYLKVRTAFVIGQPMTNEHVGSSVTSETSLMQSESQTSERGT